MAAYDAFISYSHALDKPIAAALQTVVQKLGKPWYRRRALRLFRDNTSLAASPHLWPSIEAALAGSRFLILLASPEAAASPWVGKEIEYWLAHKSVDTLLIALTSGELIWGHDAGDFVWSGSTPLPPLLKGRFATEPRWVDVSAYRGGAAPRDVRFMDLGADFAAAIHGLPKEDLLSLEVRQQRRALTLAWSAAGSLLVLTVLAGWQWQVATAQRKRAENALNAAAGTSDQLVYDLALKLRNRRGMPVELVREILGRVEGLQRQLAHGGETSVANRRLESIALGELSLTLLQQGDAREALIIAERARDISAAIATSDQGNTRYQHELMVHLNVVGDAQVALRQYDQALENFTRTRDIMAKLVAAEPDNADWKRELTTCITRVARVFFDTGRPADALPLFREALSILEPLAAQHPDRLWQADVAAIYSQIGIALVSAGDRNGAVAAYQHAVNLRRRLMTDNPRDTVLQRNLFNSENQLASLLTTLGHRNEALATYREALDLIVALAGSDPDNTLWQSELAAAYDYVGEALATGSTRGGAPAGVPEPLELFRKSLAIFERLASINPENLEWQHGIAVAENKIGDRLKAADRVKEALSAYEKSLDVAQRLVEKDPQTAIWKYDVAVGLLKIGDVVIATDRPRARTVYERSLAIRREIAAAVPSNLQWQRDVALVENRIADVDLADGRVESAIALQEDAFAIRERVLAADPANAAWRHEAVTNAWWFALVYAPRNEHAKAIAWLRKAVGIGEAPIAQELKSPDWLAQLATITEQLGNYLVHEKQPEEGLGFLYKAVALREQLTVVDPRSPQRQRDLVSSKGSVVLALVALGRPNDAIATYREALAKIETYAAAAPDNVTYQLALTECLAGLALLGDEPLARYERAIAILHRLAEESKLTPGQMEWIPNLEKAVAALPK